MRILLVSFVGNNRWSGMGKWTHAIAEECGQLGHQVTLWFEEDFPQLRGMGRLAALVFPVVLARRLIAVRRDYDVVVVHEPSGFWYGLLRRVFHRLPPIVVMSHGVESRRFELLLQADARGYAVVPRGTRVKTPLIRLWQSNGSLRRADQIICLSSFDREYLIQRLGIPPERVNLMINGVAPENFLPRHDREAGKRVLFVAGWLDAKGSFTLPTLWEAVRARHPDATLSLVGTGASAETVLRDFPEGAYPSITVIPRLTGLDQMLEQFAAHDIFLMPSLNEGSPLALLEGLAAGIPTVAGRAGGIPDIISHGEDGLLFDPLQPLEGAAELCRLLEDPELRGKLGAAGARRAANLTWRSAAETLLEAAWKAMGNRAPGSAEPAGALSSSH